MSTSTFSLALRIVLWAVVAAILWPLSLTPPATLNNLASGETWHNYPATIHAYPKHIHFPTSEEEIITIIKDAAEQKEHVKIVGSGHSWNHIAVTPTGGHMINLSKFNHVLSVNDDTHEVEMEAGVTLNQLNAFLETKGLAIHNLGHVGFQTISGAISTGTRGSGPKYGIIASHITHFRMIDSNGNVVEASNATNTDIFHAGLLGLGSLGVMTRVTLRVCAAFNIKQSSSVETIDSVFKSISDDLVYNDYYQFWWIPSTNLARVFRRNITTEPQTVTGFEAAMADFVDYYVTNPYYSAALQLDVWLPSLRPFIHSFILPWFMGGQSTTTTTIRTSHKILMGNIPDMYEEMELHVPLSIVKSAFHIIASFINTTTDYNYNFIVGVRFMPRDTSGTWLVPSFDGPQAAFAVMMYKQPEAFRHFIAELQDELRKNHVPFRPHWGKLHNMTHTELTTAFPTLPRFLQLRQQLDPNGMFLNDCLREIFDIKTY